MFRRCEDACGAPCDYDAVPVDTGGAGLVWRAARLDSGMIRVFLRVLI